MHRGFILLWRKLYDDAHDLAPTHRNPAGRREAFLDLCQMAAHSDYTYRGVPLKRGEVIVSIRGCAKRWCWSKSKVQRFMSELEARTRCGTVRGTPLGVVYRIVNYDTYVNPRSIHRDTQRDDLRDRSGTLAGHKEELKELEQEGIHPQNGRTKKPKPPVRMIPLPSDWEPTDEHAKRAVEYSLDISDQVESFRLHAEAHGRKQVNWNSAFTMWLKLAHERGYGKKLDRKPGRFYA